MFCGGCVVLCFAAVVLCFAAVVFCLAAVVLCCVVFCGGRALHFAFEHVCTVVAGADDEKCQ